MAAAAHGSPRRVLIYRLGSIGDTMVALPSLRLVHRAFPDAERAILTTRPVAREESIAYLLEGSGIAGQVIEYDRKLRSPAKLLELVRAIRRFRADLLVYLAEPRGLASTWRDILFFRLCGIPRIVGAPLTPLLQRNRPDPASGLREAEAVRLTRCIASLGDARLDDPRSWAPPLSAADHAAADRCLAGWPGEQAFIVAAANAKEPVRDWGEENWAGLLERLATAVPGLGLVLVGARGDEVRARRLAGRWNGPVLFRCGTDLRATTALLGRARLFIGTDGGPMHLAAAMGVPTVSIFAGNNPFGVWFPRGTANTVLYHRTPCTGCRLTACTTLDTACLRAIAVDAVVDACTARLLPPQPSR